MSRKYIELMLFETLREKTALDPRKCFDKILQKNYEASLARGAARLDTWKPFTYKDQVEKKRTKNKKIQK